MTNILCANSVSEELLVQLRAWLEAQWGEIDPFAGNHPEVTIPLPVVAVDEQNSLLGGLIFGSFAKPGCSEIAVWINAVLVAPSHQNKGIASKLIRSAEMQASSIEIEELFVLSEFPTLYQKLGWDIVGLDSERNATVLTKTLASD